jgi:DNA-binding GntR family transcriptional regulator
MTGVTCCRIAPMLKKPRSRYRQIADQIRDAITSGEYAPGTVLPSEAQMAERYDVDTATVHRAVGIITAEGLARARHGRGTEVRPLAPLERDATNRYATTNRETTKGAFAAEVEARGQTWATSRDLSHEQPSARIAQLLDIDPENISALVITRRMTVENTPVQLADSWLDRKIADNSPLENLDSGSGGLISRLSDLGYAQARIQETITTRTPTDEEAQALDMNENQRVYEIEHVGLTNEGRAVEVCIHVMPTHLWNLSYSWDIE